jgi:hypothetical protein
MERVTKFFTSLGGVLTSLAALVGGVVALYVAFGSGDDKASSGTPTAAVVGTTSNAAVEDWRTRVEDVCRDADRAVRRLGPPSTDPVIQLARAQAIAPIFEAFANQIRALDEPDEIRTDVERLLDNMDRQVDLMQTMIYSIQIGDAQTAQGAVVQLQQLGTDANRLMGDLELKKCVGFT